MFSKEFLEKNKSVCEKAKKIKLLLSDVDGVLNDGKIYYVPSEISSQEDSIVIAKFFNVKDGLGIRMFRLMGFKFGIITGRKDIVVKKRCKDLDCDFYLSGVRDKGEAISKVIQELKISAEEIAYIGDDLNDIPALQKVHLKIAPKDAHPLIKKMVDYITTTKGGEGVVRESIELILFCKGLHEKAVENFLEFLRNS
jgi:3-deoxy-D-manno-octulosonate 8-phosphate phosphatase (KDO 8-P phosphatase)